VATSEKNQDIGLDWAIILVEGGSQQATKDVPAAMISFSVSSGVGIRQVISSS
jgi:hypothetical protein